jgi:diguanylate cyclase (GGDEF)-like protein
MKSQLQILKKENQKLKREIEKLKDLTTIDFLTKLYNRRAFSRFLQRACREVKWSVKHRTRRRQNPQFSLLLIDIDDFKKFNDEFGHLYGDKILKKTAEFLQESVRDFDIVSRWGGEEFPIILRGISFKQAKKRAENILKKAQKQLPVTFSIGVIQSNPKYTAKQIFEKVDKALLKAKKRGKNQIVIG